LIHWGVNEKQFKKVSRISDDFFTFGTMGSLSTRKGTDLLVKAFSLAFPMRDFKDVRLICKTSSNRYDFSSRDPRIFVQMGATDFQDLMNTFIKKIDCFVFPTRGEGFGLPPLEMAACGIPSIVTGWSGPLEYFKPEMGWLLNYKMVEATSFREKIYHEPCGEWAEPDFVQLIDTMRYAYHHKDEIKQKGEFAAQYVADNWTWDKQIHLYFEALSKHL
jgi:glycosyltransferase involved in cell wall biosynthesis